MCFWSWYMRHYCVCINCFCEHALLNGSRHSVVIFTYSTFSCWLRHLCKRHLARIQRSSRLLQLQSRCWYVKQTDSWSKLTGSHSYYDLLTWNADFNSKIKGYIYQMLTCQIMTVLVMKITAWSDRLMPIVLENVSNPVLFTILWFVAQTMFWITIVLW
jgi:hypothetical protein